MLIDTGTYKDINKIVYLLSFLFFMMSDIGSIMGIAMFLALFIVFLMTPLKLKNIKDIPLNSHIWAVIISAFVVIIDKYENYLLSLGGAVLSYIFVVQSIELIKGVL